MTEPNAQLPDSLPDEFTTADFAAAALASGTALPEVPAAAGATFQLRRLARAGRVENTSQGRWRRLPHPSSALPPLPEVTHEQQYADDERHCDLTRRGAAHPPHEYSYSYTSPGGTPQNPTTGAYNCAGLDRPANPWPTRPHPLPDAPLLADATAAASNAYSEVALKTADGETKIPQVREHLLGLLAAVHAALPLIPHRALLAALPSHTPTVAPNRDGFGIYCDECSARANGHYLCTAAARALDPDGSLRSLPRPTS
jgi:hypothetical protein